MRNKFIKYSYFLVIIILISSCYAVRAYKYRKLKTMDHEKLPFITINNSNNISTYYLQEKDLFPSVTNWLDSQLINTYTNAFLVVKNDTIVYEKYFNGYNKNTLLPSYSVAKSYVATMIAIALEEGKIKSLQQPVTDYIPELLKNDIRFKEITLQNLLDMRSGIKWNEGDYGLKDDAIKMGFRPNMKPYIYKIKIDTNPILDSNYKSINTLLLGMVISKATNKTMVQYFEEKIWKNLGCENKATWNTDKRNFPITYGGLNATARDFAKLGSLYLNKGKWNGKQIVSENWINASVSKDSMTKYSGYRNQFWGIPNREYFTDSLSATLKTTSAIKSYINKEGVKYFYISNYSNRYQAEGILGQYVFVIPEKNMVMVRLGHYWTHPKFSAESLMRETWKKY